MEDNMPCITQVSGPEWNFKSTKHYLPKYKYAREMVQTGEISMQHVETRYQIADMFTKPMSEISHFEFTSQLLNIPGWEVNPIFYQEHPAYFENQDEEGDPAMDEEFDEEDQDEDL
jgi:hypothetical protein